MAMTLETYKGKGRTQRFSTNLSAFANGMYLTKQLVPEGYVKTLVNYDIDDTGSCLTPRAGRSVIQSFDYESPNLGPISLTDYVYSYNSARTEVEDIKDIVMSFGIYTTLETLLPTAEVVAPFNNPMYVSYLKHTQDNNIYDENENIIQAIAETEIVHENAWSLYCDKGEEVFNKVENADLGSMTARTITNAYAFDKPFATSVGRPVNALVSNELIAFTSPKIRYLERVSNQEMSSFTSLSTPVLTKIQLVHDVDDSYKLVRKALVPKELNIVEATSAGYNVLSETPYVFEDVSGGSLSILGMVLYETTTSEVPIFAPSVGDRVALRVYYQYPTISTTLKYKVEYLNNTIMDAQWLVMQDWVALGTTGTPFWYEFTPIDAQFLLRITIRSLDDTSTEYPMTKAYDANDNKYKALQNRTFNLNEAKGLVSWQGCVGAYGVSNAKDTIFFSDIEDPSYFPFPNNIVSFDNEILAVHNYLDYLLVITTDSVWMVMPGASIRNSLQKRILTNIFIPEIDAINLVVLKDQVFFKTDTQFYVLKPNMYTGDSTNLKNYTNSTAIANFTNNFTVETLNILNKVYRGVWYERSRELTRPVRFDSFDILDTKSTTVNEEVHYIYTIKPYIEDTEYGKLDLHLVYNSMSRSWRLYLKAIGDDSVYYKPLMYRNKQSGAFYEFFPHSYGDVSKLSITKLNDAILDDNIVHDDWALTEHYNNYNYIDTGDADIDDTTVKRFRELQINLVNVEKSEIGFYTDFFVDGNEKIHSARYEVQHITDPNDPEYGVIYVVPFMGENLTTGFVVPSETVLGNVDPSDLWKIDLSAFPELNTATIRIELQGKGRRASVQLLNTSLKRYEIADWTWIYRLMNVR